ncbi:dihydrofolate reductase [Sediminitomix flava]|uniref:Dihydrofolate reductase n=1 Tax=Sediminitomix flava TaxID=379075 RepID=A0A315Z6B4_SEDFL|nr:dihydrofolate reductase [Sediminitomix flava]PWJ39393.1 dihydrofolate reductase [Sediminitomix flava]
MNTSIIVAKALNDVIGNGNKLPWYLPADLKHFKQQTEGHHVIMGRKTFESIVDRNGKPLPNRTNIIVTSDREYYADGCVCVHSIEDAIAYAKDAGEDEAFIIGGAQVYEQSIDLVDVLYITEVKDSFEGDVYFPSVMMENWEEISRFDFSKDEKNKVNYAFVKYERK